MLNRQPQNPKPGTWFSAINYNLVAKRVCPLLVLKISELAWSTLLATG